MASWHALGVVGPISAGYHLVTGLCATNPFVGILVGIGIVLFRKLLIFMDYVVPPGWPIIRTIRHL